MITVEVNQKKHQISENSTVHDLVSNLNIQSNGIAIAVNNYVVKRIDWTTQNLNNNDTILIITSTQGG